MHSRSNSSKGLFKLGSVNMEKSVPRGNQIRQPNNAAFKISGVTEGIRKKMAAASGSRNASANRRIPATLSGEPKRLESTSKLKNGSKMNKEKHYQYREIRNRRLFKTGRLLAEQWCEEHRVDASQGQHG